MGNYIREAIENLVVREDKAVEAFQSRELAGRLDSLHREALAQEAILVNQDGGMLTTQGAPGAWCTAAEGISVLQLLMYFPTVLVDFGALDEETFILRYGVNAEQMARLAAEGFILPSLGHYESYTEAMRNGVKLPGYEREACRHLAPLIEAPSCRIASRRRGPLLNKVAPEVGRDESPFAAAVEEASTEALVSATRQADRLGALTVLNKNLSYVRRLGAGNRAITAWCERLDAKPPTAEELVSVGAELNGLKTRLASPLTAAYGGTYVLSERNYRNVLRAASVVSVPFQGPDGFDNQVFEQRLREPGLRAALELIVRLGLAESYRELQRLHAEVEFPRCPGPDEFNRFLDRLHGLRSKRKTIADFADQLRSSPHVDADTWHDYLHALKSMTREMKVRSRVSMPAFGGASFGLLAGWLTTVLPDFGAEEVTGLVAVGMLTGHLVTMRRARVEESSWSPGSKLALVRAWGEVCRSLGS